MTEEIQWEEEHKNCWFGYIKGMLFFQAYKWKGKNIWMLNDTLFYIKEKIGSDTPCLSKELAMNEAQDRANSFRIILTKE